jgi:plastocyanin
MKQLAFSLLFFPAVCLAASPEFSLSIKNHQFSPAELKVPAGQKIKLLVSNQDATPEEFESHSLNREKVISGNASATIYIGPLTPGKYAYFGEFHADTARGVIIAE